MTVVERVREDTEADEPQVLFREARRRRRRRWLVAGVVAVVVAGLVGAAVLAGSTSSTGTMRARVRIPRPGPPKPWGCPPAGCFPSSAGPLAVNATGSLFVVDGVRHQVLVRLTTGRFRVVAGDGTGGFPEMALRPPRPSSPT